MFLWTPFVWRKRYPYAIIIIYALYRSGVLNAEQLEEYDDDVQFLLAKLRKLDENNDVSEVVFFHAHQKSMDRH